MVDTTAITVRDLATLMQRSPIDRSRSHAVWHYGAHPHTIDHDTAVILGEELGVAVKWPPSEDEEEEEVVEEKAGTSRSAQVTCASSR